MRFYWSDEFMKHLDVGGSPMFAMDFDDDIGLGEFGATLPVRLVLHSHGVSAGDNHIPHAIESVSGSGQSVSIRQWGNRFGSLTLRLAGVDMAELVARRIPMGLPCKFKVGFDGMSFADWETVGIYRFDGLTGSRNRWHCDLFRDRDVQCHIVKVQSSGRRVHHQRQPRHRGVGTSQGHRSGSAWAAVLPAH